MSFYRGYKVQQDPTRTRYTREELFELKKKVKGHVRTDTLLTQKELKVLQEQAEKHTKLLDDSVTDVDIDRNLAVPVINTETGERGIVVPTLPQPIFEQKAPKGVSIRLCRRMCLTFCIILLLFNIYYVNMWIYMEYFYPLEFFRRMFDAEPTRLNRLALEIETNLLITTTSFVYATWGISVSTIFTYPPLIAAYFTWGPIFIFPYIIFAGVQIYNLTQLDTGRLKSLLLHSLWKYGYFKGTKAERNAWNQAQFSLKCCGVNGFEDWYVDWGYWLNRLDKPADEVDIRRFPESCCPDYTLLHEYGYIIRTRPYALLMLYCQYYPKTTLMSEGCFYKLILFFQSFTEQLTLLAVVIITLMAIAASWTFFGYIILQRRLKNDKMYRYSCRDWIIDFFFLRACCKFKHSQHKRIGPAPLNLEYDPSYLQETEMLELRRPRLIDTLETKERHLAEDEADAELDEAERKKHVHFLKNPLIEIVDEYHPEDSKTDLVNVNDTAKEDDIKAAGPVRKDKVRRATQRKNKTSLEVPNVADQQSDTDVNAEPKSTDKESKCLLTGSTLDNHPFPKSKGLIHF